MNNNTRTIVRLSCVLLLPYPLVPGEWFTQSFRGRVLKPGCSVFVSCLYRYTMDIPSSDAMVTIALLSHWLCYANSAVNPVIYNFMSGKYAVRLNPSLPLRMNAHVFLVLLASSTISVCCICICRRIRCICFFLIFSLRTDYTQVLTFQSAVVTAYTNPFNKDKLWILLRYFTYNHRLLPWVVVAICNGDAACLLWCGNWISRSFAV